MDPHLLLGLQCQLQRLFQHLILLLQQGLSNTEIAYTLEDERPEPENTPLEKEKLLPNHHDFRFYVNLPGGKVLGNFSGCFQIDISEAYQHLDIHLILQKHIWCLSVQWPELSSIWWLRATFFWLVMSVSHLSGGLSGRQLAKHGLPHSWSGLVKRIFFPTWTCSQFPENSLFSIWNRSILLRLSWFLDIRVLLTKPTTLYWPNCLVHPTTSQPPRHCCDTMRFDDHTMWAVVTKTWHSEANLNNFTKTITHCIFSLEVSETCDWRDIL